MLGRADSSDLSLPACKDYVVEKRSVPVEPSCRTEDVPLSCIYTTATKRVRICFVRAGDIISYRITFTSRFPTAGYRMDLRRYAKGHGPKLDLPGSRAGVRFAALCGDNFRSAISVVKEASRITYHSSVRRLKAVFPGPVKEIQPIDVKRYLAYLLSLSVSVFMRDHAVSFGFVQIGL